MESVCANVIVNGESSVRRFQTVARIHSTDAGYQIILLKFVTYISSVRHSGERNIL